jgi:hypothetical protein
MQPEITDLLHEASGVRNLVENLSVWCQEQSSSQFYGEASQGFFDYVQELGKHTIDHLQPLVDEALQYKDNQLWFLTKRQKLANVKKFWSLLHRYVKPVADGHTLKIPSSLVSYLENQASAISGLPQLGIAILVTDQLNYFQHPMSNLKDLAKALGTAIPAAKEFPKGLVFISIPYTQGSSILKNVLVYHELGHYVFHELQHRGKLQSAIAGALGDTFGANILKKANASQISWLQDRLVYWSAEIFCDLFAVKLVGPAFTFACIDLFRLMGQLNLDASKRFTERHPCDDLRFREQLKLLKDEGWWDLISGIEIEHLQLIERLAAVTESTYEFPTQKALVESFLKLIPAVWELLNETMKNIKPDLDEFQMCSSEIRKHLSHGVVPSTLIIDKKKHNPSPVTVLNSAWLFYLHDFTTLIEKIAKRDPMNVQHRSELVSRLEMWTTKALEDFELVSRAGGGH